MPDESSLQLDEDIRLMIRAREGDRSAYEKLYRRYFRIVASFVARRTGRRRECEDLAQEVFTRVWRQRGRYQPLAPVQNYLLSVAANVVRESRAPSCAHVPLDARDPDTVVDARQPTPPSQAQSVEQLQNVRTWVTSLPARQRQAVELVYLAGLPPAEAARCLGCSIGTLHAHLYHARRKLRTLARPDHEDPVDGWSRGPP